MRIARAMGKGVLLALLAGPLPARSAQPSEADAELRTAVEDLQREVALLRRKLEVKEENDARNAAAPLVGAGPDGFYLRSADKAFDLKLRGYTQFDGRYFTSADGNNVDSWLFRRVRPLLEGTLGGIVDFRLMPDFAGSQLVLQDAYLNLRYLGFANVQAGKFKSPFGLERLQSATALTFPERALPTNLVPNRDLGMMVHGSLGEGIFQYQLAFMNGVVDGGSADLDTSDGKDVVARVFAHRFQDRTEAWLSGLGVGVAFDYGLTGGGGSTPTYKTAGQATFFAYQSGTALDEHRLRYSFRNLTALGAALLAALLAGPARADRTLLNVSYDPTRELYEEFNALFARHWKEKTGETVSVQQSQGGSGKQARAVVDGLEADVVTLALSGDVNQLFEKGRLIPQAWQRRLPHNSSPYTSTIVLLVRAGNPKGIRDWEDLGKAGVSVITPNPKTSGGARWNFLAAWGYALEKWGGSELKAKELLRAIYKNAPVLDTGARGSLTTFAERGIGDVMIAWENEALLARDQFGAESFEIVVPSLSMLAEPPVALVDVVARRKGTTEVAQAYLEFLYTPAAQELVGKHHFRPSDPAALEKYRAKFAELRLLTIDEAFGGWGKAQARFFAEGGVFDQIYP